jgi:transposase
MHKLIKDEEKEKIICLYNSGLIQREIGEIYNVSQGVIHKFMKRHNIKTKNTQFKKECIGLKGSEHPNWKGKNISYLGAHRRLSNIRGKAKKCSKCGKTDGSIDWANISGKYYDPQDFIELCRKCHRAFDGQTLKKVTECSNCKKTFYVENYRIKKYKKMFCSSSCVGITNRKLNNIEELKNLYLLEGKSQAQLAKYYKVCKTTITNTLQREKIYKKGKTLK